MPILVTKDPFLMDLEVEEAYEYMQDNNVEDVNKAWLRLFLRTPNEQELSAVIQRTQQGGPAQFAEMLFSFETTKMADSYRHQHGPFFSIRRANEICKTLFGRMIGLHEAIEVKELIKQSEPYEMSEIYKWIADQVKLLEEERPTKKLESLYQVLVLRPPYPFEIKYHNEIL